MSLKLDSVFVGVVVVRHPVILALGSRAITADLHPRRFKSAKLYVMADASSLEAQCNAMVRDEVRAKWEQSGRDFGRSAPPPPTLRVDGGSDGELRVSVDQF